MRITAFVVVSVFALALAACAKKDETPKTSTVSPSSPPAAAPPAAGVSVASINVGNAVASNKKVQGSGSITPRDTIYVSIDTTGSGEATLKSRWTFLQDGKTIVVKEDSQRVSPNGPATHEFHISKPDAWPKGEYQVEIFVNDTSAATRRFTVA